MLSEDRETELEREVEVKDKIVPDCGSKGLSVNYLYLGVNKVIAVTNPRIYAISSIMICV